MPAIRKSISLQIFGLLFIAFGVALSGVVIVSQNAINLADERASARQERFAARTLAATIAGLPQQQRSATVWDDAVENVAAGNEKWMDDNLGHWMQSYFGHNESYVLDRDDTPVFASVSGSIRSADAYAVRADAIAPLVAQLRTVMAEVSAGLENPFEALADVAVVAALRFGDDVIIASVVPIVSDSGEVYQAPGTEKLHIAVRYVDDGLAQEIGLPIELDGVAFNSSSPDKAQVGTPITDPSGEVLSWLVWTPERPGTDLFLKMLPLLSMVGTGGGAMILWLAQRLSRISRQLQAREAQARLDLEALQQAREAAKVADRAKMNFMSIVSHELRTPLTVILGYARLGKNLEQFPVARQLYDRLLRQPVNVNLVQSSVDELVSFATTGMEKVEKSGEHLLFLVNQLLDYAKIESGHLEVYPEICDVREVLEPVVEQMRVLTEEKGLQLEARIPACAVLADVTRTRQILINLMGNAIKFTDSGKVSVVVVESEDQVHIDVSDTGVGIEPHELEKIFHAFHQAELSLPRNAAGTGLGLSVAKELALLSGGTISVRSKVGEGSTFTLSLPKETTRALEKAA
tara:strand:+ start:285 stop:2015 length:1731 start_codon:yes stop_codon:yes gene_type:complete